MVFNFDVFGIPKRDVFISYCQYDQKEAEEFIYKWAEQEQVFVPKRLGGVSDEDDFIASTDPDYVTACIRERHLQDSSVTIMLLGNCTHSRRYIDWEIMSSLRNGTAPPNGMLGILLPSCKQALMPPRFMANWNKAPYLSYARCHHYPLSAYELRGWIEDAHNARTERTRLIDNTAAIMWHDAECQICGLTH